MRRPVGEVSTPVGAAANVGINRLPPFLLVAAKARRAPLGSCSLGDRRGRFGGRIQAFGILRDVVVVVALLLDNPAVPGPIDSGFSPWLSRMARAPSAAASRSYAAGNQSGSERGVEGSVRGGLLFAGVASNRSDAAASADGGARGRRARRADASLQHLSRANELRSCERPRPSRMALGPALDGVGRPVSRPDLRADQGPRA